MKKRTCEGCDGSGLRVPAVPCCRLDVGESWIVVERCDTCGKLPDDLAAAQKVFSDAVWTRCVNGGDHAIGRKRQVEQSGSVR